MYGSESTVRNGASDVMRVLICRLTSARLLGVSALLRKRLNPRSLERERQLVDRVGDGMPSSLALAWTVLVWLPDG